MVGLMEAAERDLPTYRQELAEVIDRGNQVRCELLERPDDEKLLELRAECTRRLRDLNQDLRAMPVAWLSAAEHLSRISPTALRLVLGNKIERRAFEQGELAYGTQ